MTKTRRFKMKSAGTIQIESMGSFGLKAMEDCSET